MLIVLQMVHPSEIVSEYLIKHSWSLVSTASNNWKQIQVFLFFFKGIFLTYFCPYQLSEVTLQWYFLPLTVFRDNTCWLNTAALSSETLPCIKPLKTAVVNTVKLFIIYFWGIHPLVNIIYKCLHLVRICLIFSEMLLIPPE